MFNPMQFIRMAQGGGNPQQMMQNFIKQNPQMANLMQNVNMNDPNAMENLCRNICVQKGLDFDTMVAQFKQQGGKL